MVNTYLFRENNQPQAKRNQRIKYRKLLPRKKVPIK